VFKSVLVANRGEIARRVIRSARNLGLRTVAVDAELPFVAEADDTLELTGPPAQAYRDTHGLLDVTGPKCNLPFHAELLEHPEFVSGRYDTGLVARMHS
jgi:acetyl-CoA carboxylase biotin carboxylase subunit